MRSPRGVPLALSRSDVPDGPRLLVHSCEDCACPVRHVEAEAPHRTELPPGPLARAHGILSVRLDADHRALFGPHGNGGVVVVNEAAHAVLDSFAEADHAPEPSAAGPESTATHAVLTRLLDADLLHPSGSEPTPRFGESRQLTVWMHVTNACNLACPYCYVRKSPEAMDTATATETVDAIVRSAVQHGFTSLRLKYAGGEASLNTEVLFALHDHAVGRCEEAGLGLSAVLLSNGVAISEALARRLVDREIAVMISLDGIGAAHDVQRPTVGGRPSFAMVERSIERLRAAGCAPHLSITITGRNVGGIAEVVRFALERELTFSFNFFRDNACSAGVDGLQYEEQAMIDGVRAAFAVIEELLPPWSVLGSVLDRGQLLQPRQKSCGVGDDYVVVNQHGQIAQCHMELGSTLGDVRQVDPVRAVRSDSAPIRNLLVDDKAGCRDCTWRHWCSGGCAVATFAATGRFDVRSPNCRIYKAVYPEAVRLEGLRLLAYARPTA